jgi:CheY-like chemotaxis protein
MPEQNEGLWRSRTSRQPSFHSLVVVSAKGQVLNDVIVARDGVEALDFLFATGPYSGRDISNLPQLMLLDLKLPKVDGLEVLRKRYGL